MSITSKKITAYSKTHQMLPPVPSPAFSAAELQVWYDTAAEEIRVAYNSLIDALGATTTGDSGAEGIGVEPIIGIGATNVQDALEQLRVLINDAVAGAIPDGTITPAKLSFDPATQPELDAHAADNTHTRYAVATGAANTYAITLSPAPTSYAEGMSVRVKINVLNSAASTININGLGAKSIKKASGNDVLAGNLKVGIVYTLTYNGTNFILQGEGGEYGTATMADVLSPLTIGTEAGLVTGTLTLTGNATDADVLATKTYYNTDAKTKRTGTISNLGAANISASFAADVAISAGYRNGSGLVKKPIPAAGTTELNKLTGFAGRNSSWIKVATATINVDGSYRVIFAIHQNASGTAYGRIYKNGVATGIQRSTTSLNPVEYTEDFAAVAGDTLELWVQSSGTSVQPDWFAVAINIPVYAALAFG